MTVYIVMVNGSVSEVFDSLEAAKLHAKNKNRQWSTTEVLTREVKSL